MCSLNCLETDRSRSLEIKERLEIGRWLLGSSGSRFGFLRTGVTIACLRVAGKTPEEREQLIILVIGSTRQSTQRFSSTVGMGYLSRQQDLFGGRGDKLTDVVGSQRAER